MPKKKAQLSIDKTPIPNTYIPADPKPKPIAIRANEEKLIDLAERRGVTFTVEGDQWNAEAGGYSDSGNMNIPEIVIMKAINNVSQNAARRSIAPAGAQGFAPNV